MYKLFLTLRYLTRKKIVIFPILVVWLCVMMLIIVTSIMQGFVDRVRETNHDLFGDIIVSSPSSSQGFAGYAELSARLTAQFKDQIEGTTPVVEAYSLVYVPMARRSVPALLVGVTPEERSRVTKFRESLFEQYQAPMEAVDDLSPRLPADKDSLASFAGTRVKEANSAKIAAEDDLASFGDEPPPPRPALIQLWVPVAGFALGLLLWWRARRQRDVGPYITSIVTGIAGLLIGGAAIFWPIWFPRSFSLADDRAHQAQMAWFRAQRTFDYANALPASRYQSREDLIKTLVPPKPSFNLPIDAPPGSPPEGCIVGAQLGFFKRDTRGNFVHWYPSIYPRVSITVFPPSKSGNIDVEKSIKTNAQTHDFTIVDESHTGVFDVDQNSVYAPFETVQFMAGMRPDPRLAAEPDAQFDPRCHQILIRLKPGFSGDLRELRSRMSKVVQEFAVAYADTKKELLPTDLRVETWDEKQARYVGAVQNEKTMITFILLLMSGVVLVVIFLIFYQIVRDKTRDIGIIKAVGGSEEGVAAIFLSYGLLIGIVGGGLGSLSGWLFVIHTNQIHEWIYQVTGIIIWDRSVYIFDRIPDVVHFTDVVLYFCVALIAGVVGALIPAIIAAFEDPVQAVRYE